MFAKTAIPEKKAAMIDKDIPNGVSPSSSSLVKRKLGLEIIQTDKKQIRKASASYRVISPLMKITERIEAKIGEVLKIVNEEEILIYLKDSKSKKLHSPPKKHLTNKVNRVLFGLLNCFLNSIPYLLK